jgi:hypothetical protein
MEGGEIKRFKITGSAAEEMLKGTKTRRRTVARGVPLSGGSSPLSAAPLSAAPLSAAPLSAAPLSAAPLNKTSAPPPSPIPMSTPTPPSSPITVQQGGKAVKVILDPSKKKTKKLVLSPPKTVIKLPGRPDLPKKQPNNKTQKISRRIRVSVDGLKKRVHRAKTIKKESQKMPIEQLKKDLQKAGLIKDGSKAPEGILRQMYSDFEVLKQRAL